MLLVAGCSNETEVVTDASTDVEQRTPETREDEIMIGIEQIVKEQYGSTSIKEIDINQHYGTDDTDDYIALIYLSFDAKNTVGTSKEMIEMYGSDLAARLADEKDISEITIFWEVPYLKEGVNIAKFNLVREGEDMVFKDKWFAPLFN
jgi:hypothetical protein